MTSDNINFDKTSGEWLSGEGPESDIVISSRIRLARNINIFPFMARMDVKQRSELEEFVRSRIMNLTFPSKLTYYSLDNATEMDLEYLVERHLISRDLAQVEGAKAVAIGEHEITSIMINEEDHLRIQTLLSGFQLDRLWKLSDQVDDILDSVLPYSFHPQFGYLTACPTNVGTGMRVSVMLHLPGLAITNQIEKVFYAVSKISLAVRGLYGEGSNASSDFYQISNQITLGKTEEQLLDNLKSVIPQIIRYEREARQKLFHDDRNNLEDKIFRAWGIMKNARVLSLEECLEHMSTLRLGVNLDILKDIPLASLNELFILSLPAHLQKKSHLTLNDLQKNKVRADHVREIFSKL